VHVCVRMCVHVCVCADGAKKGFIHPVRVQEIKVDFRFQGGEKENKGTKGWLLPCDNTSSFGLAFLSDMKPVFFSVLLLALAKPGRREPSRLLNSKWRNPREKARIRRLVSASSGSNTKGKTGNVEAGRRGKQRCNYAKKKVIILYTIC